MKKIAIFICVLFSLLVPALGHAESFPAYNIPKNCKEYAHGMGEADIEFFRGMNGYKGPLTEEHKKTLAVRTEKRYNECLQKENVDKARGLALWAKASATLKNHCVAHAHKIALSHPTNRNSYFRVAECLEEQIRYGQMPFPVTDYAAYCKKQMESGHPAFSTCLKEQEMYREKAVKLWPAIAGKHRQECVKAVEYELSDLNIRPVRWVKTSAGSYKELWKCVDEVIQMYGAWPK